MAEYGHDEGRSITACFVYRGNDIPDLQGVYMFGDFTSGTIWGLFPNDSGGYMRRVLGKTDLSVVSFADDDDGELYVVDLYGGRIYWLVAAPGA
ncbi:MAG: hypothetical protein M3294_03960 [Pseudomonadota bacterium]|nr:hypothetical protein [Pseudomonadota bacterium]